MAVLGWLLNSDPGLRWQVLRDGEPSRWNTPRALRVLGLVQPPGHLLARAAANTGRTR